MRRIGLAVALIASLMLVPLVAWGQPADRARQVGVLVHGTGSEGGGSSSFEGALRERGWVIGRNITVEYRYSEGRPERLRDLATDLAHLRPDVIVAHTNQAIAAVQASTTRLPIVMMIAVDPVGAGLVASLAHPGGN